jgi:transcriptional regulator with XRE-family HTH domain
MPKRTATKRDFSLAFGQVLKRIRKDRHLSQVAFGNLVGLHRTHISFIELGLKIPMIATVYEISVALGIPMAELIEQTVQEYETHYKNKPLPI